MGKLKFSFSTTEKKKVNLYEGKIGLIIKAVPTEAGSSSKLEFTVDAVKAYNLTLSGAEYMTFGYDENDNPIICINAPKGKTSSRLGKNGVFSNKKLHELICTLFILDNTVENFIETSELQTEEEMLFIHLTEVNSVKEEMTAFEVQGSLEEEMSSVTIPSVNI